MMPLDRQGITPYNTTSGVSAMPEEEATKTQPVKWPPIYVDHETRRLIEMICNHHRVPWGLGACVRVLAEEYLDEHPEIKGQAGGGVQ